MTHVPPSLLWMVPSRLSSPLVSVCHRFANFDLVASPEIKFFGRYVIHLGGVHGTDRTLSFIEGEIPNDLESPLEVAAWVSYVLKSDRAELDPLPDWFIEGEQHWDLVFARMFPGEWERKRAYGACPKCFINRDYARPLRRNLLEELSCLAGETGMTFSFDGRVLSISTNESVHEVVASGDSWPSSYQVFVSPESKLPTRFQYRQVEVSVFEDYVSFDRIRFGPCQAVE